MLKSFVSQPSARPESSIAYYTRQATTSVQEFLDDLAQHPQDLLLPKLAAAKTHHIRPAGKLIRPLAVLLLSRALGVAEERVRPYALLLELVHVATLLHDDVIDRAARRRNRPTTNQVYDNTVPVLAGDALLAEVISETVALDDMVMAQVLSAVLQDLVAGEVWQYDLKGVIHDDLRICIEIAELKTASLLSLCTWIPAHLAGLSPELCEDFAAIGRYTGVSFQLIDDLIDFCAAESGKPRFADWQEGRMNAMSVLLVNRRPAAAAELDRLFRAERRPTEKECEDLLQRCFPRPLVYDDAAELRTRAREYAAQASHHARLVPVNQEGRLFEELRSILLERIS